MDYRGIAALIIAASLGAMLVIRVLGMVLWNSTMSEAGASAVTAVGGALVGALTAYMINRPPNPPEPPSQTPIQSPPNPPTSP